MEREENPQPERVTLTHNNQQPPEQAGAMAIINIPDDDNSQPSDQAAAVSIMAMSPFTIIGIRDVVKFGKYLLRVAIPMGFTLVLSSSALVPTTEGHLLVISIAVSVALALNGCFLRDTHPITSNCMLLSASALLLLSFFALLGFFLPLSLKWIPLLACFLSLITFAMSVWANFHRGVE